MTKYIDEIETYDSNVGEQSTFHQLYKDMMTAFLAYVTYLQLKYHAVWTNKSYAKKPNVVLNSSAILDSFLTSVLFVPLIFKPENPTHEPTRNSTLTPNNPKP